MPITQRATPVEDIPRSMRTAKTQSRPSNENPHKGAPLPSTQMPNKVPTPDARPAKQPPVRPKGVPTPSGKVIKVGARFGNGLTNLGSSTMTSGPIIALLTLTFAVVAIAKMRGAANIDTTHAVFGGIVLALILSGIYAINAKLATMFAALVLVQALLEYGNAALTGIGNPGVGIANAVGKGAANPTGSTAKPSASTAGGLLNPTETSGNPATVAGQTQNSLGAAGTLTTISPGQVLSNPIGAATQGLGAVGTIVSQSPLPGLMSSIYSGILGLFN